MTLKNSDDKKASLLGEAIRQEKEIERSVEAIVRVTESRAITEYDRLRSIHVDVTVERLLCLARLMLDEKAPDS